MFCRLLKKEIFFQSKSILYALYCILATIFFLMMLEIPSTHQSLMPQPGQKSYGTKIITEHGAEMKKMYYRLLRDYHRGKTSQNRLIVSVDRIFTQNERAVIEKILKKMNKLHGSDQFIPNITYEEYLKTMRELDKMLGGNTHYGDKFRNGYLHSDRTYKEAIEDFNEILQKDKLTNAYGRVYADYMQIIVMMIGAFIPSLTLIRSSRYKLNELIFIRKVSSFTYVLSKFLAVLIISILPFIVADLYITYVFFINGLNNQYTIDLLGIYRYLFIWVLPSLLFVISLAMFLSIVFNNFIVPIIVQGLIFIKSVSLSFGDYTIVNFIIRFFKIGEYEKYINAYDVIMANRAFYTIVSVILIMFTTLVWNKRRSSYKGV